MILGYQQGPGYCPVTESQLTSARFQGFLSDWEKSIRIAFIGAIPGKKFYNIFATFASCHVNVKQVVNIFFDYGSDDSKKGAVTF
ncbi:hypothetical protein, partial [Glutamicibacter uratoxydans]